MPELAEIHEVAIKEFDAIQAAQREERMQSLNDRRFYTVAGAQWEDQLGEQFKNRPKFEINLVHLAVIRIINDYRNNRITVDFVDKSKNPQSKLADTLDGMYRAMEQDSGAEEAYDNAFEEAVAGGIGAWRLRAVYEDEEDDENECQKVIIEPIYDADSCVYFDLGAKRQDKRDARSCYVLVSMTLDEFKEKWPDADPTPTEKVTDQSYFDWGGLEDTIWIAEYYKVIETSTKVYIYETIGGEEIRIRDYEIDPREIKTMEAQGTQLLRTKTIKRRQVHKYIMSGSEILEDCGTIAGSEIPIVMVYGKRVVVDNIERAQGQVRLSKDAQRVKNVQTSKLAEISAISSVRKPIMIAAMVKGHENEWANDNIENYPYLLVNPIEDKDGQIIQTGPNSYLEPPDIPQPLAALLQISTQDLKELLGNQQAGEEIVANLSGKAVELVQNRLDMQSFVYVSNLAKAMKRCGEIWLSMIREIYVEENREVELMDRQGQLGQQQLNKKIIGTNGREEFESDIANAKCAVSVDIGPSSSSQRSATVRALTAMMNMNPDPETAQVLSNMAMLNMEGEGVGDARGYFRMKLIRMGVLEPNEHESEKLKQEAENTKPDPNAVYLEAEAERAHAQAAKLRADAIKSLAGAENLSAETIEIMAGIDDRERELVMKGLELLHNLNIEQVPPPKG